MPFLLSIRFVMEENHMDQFNIFQAPPTNTAVKTREWIDFRPINQITDYASLEFNIPSQSSGYMDLKNSVIKIKFQLTNEFNQPVSKSEPVALANLALHSIFVQVDCALQQLPVQSLRQHDTDQRNEQSDRSELPAVSQGRKCMTTTTLIPLAE